MQYDIIQRKRLTGDETFGTQATAAVVAAGKSLQNPVSVNSVNAYALRCRALHGVRFDRARSFRVDQQPFVVTPFFN